MAALSLRIGRIRTPTIPPRSRGAESGFAAGGGEICDHFAATRWSQNRRGKEQGGGQAYDIGAPTGCLWAIAQVASISPNSQLLSYRAAVDDSGSEQTLATPRSARAEGLVAGLRQPELAAVLSHLDEGVDTFAARSMDEIRNYQPNVRSSAGDLPTFVRIFLLSQIDAVWWSRTGPSSPTPTCCARLNWWMLTPLRSAKMLRFEYRAQSAGLPAGLGLRHSDRHCRRSVLGRPDCASHVRGPRLSPSSTRLLVSATVLPPGIPRLWVTSMVRSVAAPASAAIPRLRRRAPKLALCRIRLRCGDAVVPPVRSGSLLARLLLERQAEGKLNVIDEGQALGIRA